MEKQLGKDITTQEFKACYPNQTRVPFILIQEEENGPRRIIGSYDELIKFLENGNSALTAKSEDTNGNSKKEDRA